MRAYTELIGSKTIFFPITGECLLSLPLSLFISNMTTAWRTWIWISLEPILISYVSPPLPTHPLGSSPPPGRRQRRRRDPSLGIGYKYIFLRAIERSAGEWGDDSSPSRERRGILGRKVGRLLESKISWTRGLAPTSSKINPFFIELCPSPLSFSLFLLSSLSLLFFPKPSSKYEEYLIISCVDNFRFDSIDRSSLRLRNRVIGIKCFWAEDICESKEIRG